LVEAFADGVFGGEARDEKGDRGCSPDHQKEKQQALDYSFYTHS
jgi:hypothetical protein